MSVTIDTSHDPMVRLDASGTDRLLKGRCTSPRRLEAPLGMLVQTRRLQWRVQAFVQGLGLWRMGLDVTPGMRGQGVGSNESCYNVSTEKFRCINRHSTHDILALLMVFEGVKWNIILILQACVQEN